MTNPTTTINDHADLKARFDAAVDRYAKSADRPEDRRAYYAERDAVWAILEDRNSALIER